MSQAASWRRLETSPSTNLDARAWVDEGAPHGAVVIAQRQTAGRGRQGRAWESPAGALTFSVIVRDGIDRLLPLRAGLAVAQCAGPKARVKWPNDVLLDGRKLAGVLTELHADAAVVGIGINAAVDVAALPDEVAARAASLDLAEHELEGFAEQVVERVLALVAEAPAAVLRGIAARDALVGRAVRWDTGGRVAEGTAVGIGEDGRLHVQGDDGQLVALDGGDVHLL